VRLERAPAAALVTLVAAWAALVVCAGAALAAPGGQAGEADLDRAAREIGRVLKCPVCQNVSVADSPSDLAQQMRDLIRRKLEAGESRDEIVAYFVERYGHEALLDPPRSGVFQALWWGSGAIAVGGAVAVATTLRRWMRAARRGMAPAAPELELAARGDGA
jgi:cytochrome c-type biogenesis protein CcmH